MDSHLVDVEGFIHSCDEHVKVILKIVSKHEDLIARKNSKVDENSDEKVVDGLYVLQPVQFISSSEERVANAKDSQES